MHGVQCPARACLHMHIGDYQRVNMWKSSHGVRSFTRMTARHSTVQNILVGVANETFRVSSHTWSLFSCAVYRHQGDNQLPVDCELLISSLDKRTPNLDPKSSLHITVGGIQWLAKWLSHKCQTPHNSTLNFALTLVHCQKIIIHNCIADQW